MKKGEKTLSLSSPLIMFELKHGHTVNLPLINRFKDMGYESYRLIPGLNTLIPFDQNEPFDGFLLNLFCCKEDKATQLEEEGILARRCEGMNTHVPQQKHSLKGCHIGVFWQIKQASIKAMTQMLICRF